MARITFCDGNCGRSEDLNAKPAKMGCVVVAITSEAASTYDTLHLCKECETRVRADANPKAWPRKAVAA